MSKKYFLFGIFTTFILLLNVGIWFFIIKKQTLNFIGDPQVEQKINYISTIRIQKPFFVEVGEKFTPFTPRETQLCGENDFLWTNTTYGFKLCLSNDWSSYDSYVGKRIPLNDITSTLAKFSPEEQKRYLSNMDIQGNIPQAGNGYSLITQVGRKTFIEYYNYDDIEKKYYYGDNKVYFQKDNNVISITFDKTNPEHIKIIETLDIIE